MLSMVTGAAILIMITSLIGVIFTYKTAQKFLQNRLSFLVAFSAGVFLVTAGALGLEVFELADSVWQGAALIALGYLIAWGLHALLPETHHHHDPNCSRSHGRAAKKLIVGDAIHNVADGVILVVAFAVSPALGIAATISIVIHEALQEISEFFVLRQAGYSVTKALTINFAVSSTILIGVGLGYLALASHELEILLLALSSGFFLQIVVHDLLPKRANHENGSLFFKHLSFVLVGALLMGGVAGVLGDTHTHGDGHAHNEEEHHEDGHHDELHEDEHHDEDNHDDETPRV
ncbi:MAG TPA: ZIP family metal transporter [Candidatus Paceibacterota bacterium]|nr:ZIP family metal transporter [Candidatus Paceibacterota bacterium]HMO83126.1 ZIP family metal transporter [Candidatus Paceibacterota bacterium]